MRTLVIALLLFVECASAQVYIVPRTHEKHERTCEICGKTIYSWDKIEEHPYWYDGSGMTLESYDYDQPPDTVLGRPYSFATQVTGFLCPSCYKLVGVIASKCLDEFEVKVARLKSRFIDSRENYDKQRKQAAINDLQKQIDDLKAKKGRMERGEPEPESHAWIIDTASVRYWIDSLHSFHTMLVDSVLPGGK